MPAHLTRGRRHEAHMEYEDTPAGEERWCDECRGRIVAYLKREAVHHGRVGERPAWHVAPYVSIWAIESGTMSDAIGWWVICGDLPTDYVSGHGIAHPREALRAFVRRWSAFVAAEQRGESLEDWCIGDGSRHAELAPMLESRARLLLEWADDDSCWEP
ncbi:MAG: DUF4826 family protein [Solimonas sp.]